MHMMRTGTHKGGVLLAACHKIMTSDATSRMRTTDKTMIV